MKHVRQWLLLGTMIPTILMPHYAAAQVKHGGVIQLAQAPLDPNDPRDPRNRPGSQRPAAPRPTPPQIAPPQVAPPQVAPRQVAPLPQIAPRPVPAQIAPRQVVPPQVAPSPVVQPPVIQRVAPPPQIIPRQVVPAPVVPAPVVPRQVVPGQTAPQQVVPRQIQQPVVAPRPVQPAIAPRPVIVRPPAQTIIAPRPIPQSTVAPRVTTPAPVVAPNPSLVPQVPQINPGAIQTRPPVSAVPAAPVPAAPVGVTPPGAIGRPFVPGQTSPPPSAVQQRSPVPAGSVAPVAPLAPVAPAAPAVVVVPPAVGTPPGAIGRPFVPGQTAPPVPTVAQPRPAVPSPAVPSPVVPGTAVPGTAVPSTAVPTAVVPRPTAPLVGAPAAPPPLSPAIAAPALRPALPATPPPLSPPLAPALTAPIAPPALSPALLPPIAAQVPPLQQPRKQGRIGLGGAVAIGVGAGILGGILATQGAQALSDVQGRREEVRDGDVVIFREPGRTIIREDDRIFIERDESERYRDLGIITRSDRRGDELVTIFDRPDGVQIVTVTDESGRLLRRVRRDRNGVDIVIIDNQRRDGGEVRFAEEVVLLPPPPLLIAQESYVVDGALADQTAIYEALSAPPVARLPRRYTLDEVRYSRDLRAHMRSVDVDSITFDPGSWTVSRDQISRLATLAAGVKQAIQQGINQQTSGQQATTEVFLVEGHTDAVGNDVDNVSLSDRRAQAVAEILSRDFAIPPENFTIQGYGPQQLKVQTQGPDRRNRRVTLRRITPLLTGQAQ